MAVCIKKYRVFLSLGTLKKETLTMRIWDELRSLRTLPTYIAKIPLQSDRSRKSIFIHRGHTGMCPNRVF